WETFFTQIGEYKANPAAFAAKYGSPHPPQPPKAKKLQRLNNASLPLEGSKFSIKSAKVGKKRVEVLGLTVWKKQILVPLKHKGMITKVGIKNINNAKLSYSNGFLFVDFTYIKTQGEAAENTEENKEVEPKPIKKRKTKRAGLDIGLNNLFSLFVDDRDSKSVIYSGRELKSRNAKFNRFNAKLNESIANEVTEWREKTRTRKDGDGNAFSEVIKYPVSHSQRGEELKKYKSYLIEKRNLYFDTEFHKITANLVKHLVKQGVTDLVLSKNLSFAKTEGDIMLGKKVMQNFMQIPFGRMLNKLEEKCVSVGIAVHFIDEAWTSKTSCISGNVNNVQRKAAKSRQSVLTTDLNGSRVKRGMFKDKTINKVFNADLNGAVNHIKVGFKRAK
uniref:transposase n=1 Tax=Vibrio crassostreae TaxID=246167 RepID=UPI001B301D44